MSRRSRLSRLRRVRRPLVALVLLVVALAIGYAVRASHGRSPRPPLPSSTRSAGGWHPAPPLLLRTA